MGPGPEFSWVIVAAALFAVAIAAGHGRYSPIAFALLLAAVVAFTRAIMVRGAPGRAQASAGDDRAEARFAALALIAVLVVGITDAPAYFAASATLAQAWIVHGVLLAALVGALVLRGLRAQPSDDRAWRIAAGAGIASAVVFRIWVLVASPAPLIDVFYQYQESAQHLLGGLNPYLTPVSDPSGAAERYGYLATVYSYPPLNLYPQAIAVALLGDIRYATIAADGVTAAAIIGIVPRDRRLTGILLALFFLHQPRSYFVLEQAWNEPLMIAAAASFCWLAVAAPASRWRAPLLGLFLGLKQYLVFFALPIGVVRRDWRMLAVATAVIVALWAPFLLWDWDAAIRNGLLFQFSTPFRPDGLNVSSFLHIVLGWMPTKWVAISAGLLAMFAAAWRMRGDTTISAWLYTGIAGTLAAFLFGTQAFANYYHFIASLLVVLAALRLREDDRSRFP